jgi:hypothetical protein
MRKRSKAEDRVFVLQKVQPALLGLMAFWTLDMPEMAHIFREGTNLL